MTANKPMTGEQLDELMTVAVNMQRDSEKAGDRPTSMFAYAVQVAVLELRKVREINPVDEDHAAAMNCITAIIAILGSSDTLGISEQVAELKTQRDALAAENAGLKGALSKITFTYPLSPHIHGITTIKTPATDASLAEVRAQGVEMFAEMYACEAIKDGDVEGWKSNVSNAASEYAAQLRKEAAQ